MKTKHPKNKLRDLRTAAGLTQAELGKAVGVTHTAICRLELRYDAPSADLAQNIAEYFNTDVASVFPAMAKKKPVRFYKVTGSDSSISISKKPAVVGTLEEVSTKNLEYAFGVGALRNRAISLLSGRSVAEMTRIINVIEAAFPR